VTPVAKPNLKRFLLRLALIYLVLAACWPLVRRPYERQLAEMTAPFLSLVTYDDVKVTRMWCDRSIHFELDITSQLKGTKHVIQSCVDPLQYGFAHITFAALALAIPGWHLRRRLIRWLIGSVTLQAFFIFMMLLTFVSLIASQGFDFWSGDLITSIFSYRLYLSCPAFLSTIGQQLVPVLLWLTLFVYPLRSVRHHRAIRP